MFTTPSEWNTRAAEHAFSDALSILDEIEERAIRDSEPWRVWQTEAERGLAEAQERLEDLATLLLLEGVQPLVVSEMLGHASVAFTLATYGHVLAEMRKPARGAMERLFGGAFG
ncbi:MAG TPA: hypothetical protein VKQ36_07725 [Ktedonobacterales bacterium]|nr:hypothetical protein [Ktedonobacterales bacterium]